jgi:hypothetical protein
MIVNAITAIVVKKSDNLCPCLDCDHHYTQEDMDDCECDNCDCCGDLECTCIHCDRHYTDKDMDNCPCKECPCCGPQQQ